MEWLFSTALAILYMMFGLISAEPTMAPLQTATGTVVAVIDGDTIDVRLGDQIERVRYIGVDTPEPYRGGEPACYASEASQFNRDLVTDQVVLLEADQEDRDKYDRLLRYVYVGDVFVNAELVRGGYATTLTIPPNTREATYLSELETTAKQSERGLWRECR